MLRSTARQRRLRGLLTAFAGLCGMALACLPHAIVAASPSDASGNPLLAVTGRYAMAADAVAVLLSTCTPPQVAWAWARANADLLDMAHDARAARRLWGDAQSIAADAHWALREAQAMNAGARISLDSGDLDDAQRSSALARERAREIGDTAGEADADFILGNSLRLLGDVANAQKFAAAAADLARARGDVAMSARALTLLGVLSKNKGDYLEGLEYEIQALSHEPPDADIQTRATTLFKLGKLYEQIEDNAQALDYQNRALTLAQTQPRSLMRAHILVGYANTLNDLSPEQAGRARDYASQSLAFSLETGNRTLEVDSELQLARAQFSQGLLDQAMKSFDHVLATARAIGQKPSIAHILLRQGELFERVGRLAEALTSTRGAIELYRDTNNLPRLIKAYTILERQLDAGGDHAGALTARLQRFELRDRVLGASAMRNLAELEANRHQESQKQEIELLKRQSEIDTLRLERGALMRWLVILVATMLAFALLLVVWRFYLSLRVNRLLHSKNLEISAQKQALESVNIELRNSADRLYQVASTDALTGALSRSHGLESLSRKLADASGSSTCLSVLLIDVDHFKLVNDRHGHLHGDRVLAHIAEGLAACLHQGEALVRFGGEEFLVLLPDTELPAAAARAEMLRTHIDQMPRLPALHQHVTISIGVCALSQLRQPDIESLLGGADEALYAAKHAGRNRVRVHQAGVASTALHLVDP
jgi:diguanylate cyclase (GGDEF)-like protein